MKAIYTYTAEYEFYTQKFINHKKTNIHITQGFICAFKKIYVYIIAFLKKKLQKTLKKKLPKCSGCKYVTLSSEFAGNKLINV